jgi:hypothetical protein
LSKPEPDLVSGIVLPMGFTVPAWMEIDCSSPEHFQVLKALNKKKIRYKKKPFKF